MPVTNSPAQEGDPIPKPARAGQPRTWETSSVSVTLKLSDARPVAGCSEHRPTRGCGLWPVRAPVREPTAVRISKQKNKATFSLPPSHPPSNQYFFKKLHDHAIATE